MIQKLVILTKDTVADYGKIHPEQFNPAWKQRDFVTKINEFMRYRSGGIKIISGLRGTGKTVGLMQTIKANDALYLRCTEKGKTSINEIQDVINSYPEKSNIIIDEFTWLKEFLPPVTDDAYTRRSDAERFIVALSESGKNIFLTGMESASLEAIKARGFIHRTADTLHVTRFSFAEFTRIYEDHLPSRPHEVYTMYLREGGIFEDYVKKSIKGMDGYIRNTIVENLYTYIGSDTGLTRQKIASAVYTVLFEAVHDTVNSIITREDFTEQAKVILAKMGIPDVTEKLHPRIVQRISETLESIGVIIKIPNILPRQDRRHKEGSDSDDVRTYIVNPAISYQLVKVVFGEINDENKLFERLMEAAVFVELNAIKRPMDQIYFYDHENREVDAVIVPIKSESPITLLEVKHRYEISASDIHNKTWSILSDDVEKAISKRFPDNDIGNRYFVYTGSRNIRTDSRTNRTYLLIGIDTCLQHYWDFGGNMDLIQKEVHRNNC